MVGSQASKQHILPIFLMLFRDESSEVRLKLFSRLDDLNSVISIEELQLSLIPSLEELAIEKNWRLKMQVIDYFPMLARQLGE
jgi:serine/threonine-protein phosphatase 2A regulatory subunit A